MTRTLEEILADYRSTFTATQEEERQREELRNSEEYLAFQRVIEGAQKEQQEMLAKVPDCREEMEADKQELIAYMQQNDIKQAAEFKAKTRVKRSVDTSAVLRAMEGDIDNLMLVTSIKQKDLEEFIKSNPEYKRDLRSCIIEEGYTITDIVLAV